MDVLVVSDMRISEISQFRRAFTVLSLSANFK